MNFPVKLSDEDSYEDENKFNWFQKSNKISLKIS